MKCVINYKGKEFQNQNELKDYLRDNDIRGVNLQREITYTVDSSFTSGQQKEITNSAAYFVYLSAGKDVEAIADMDLTELLTDWVLKASASKPAGSVYRDRFKEVGEMVPFFVQEVKKFFKSKGISISESLVEDEDGNFFTENKLTLTTKSKASAQVRAFISMIPEQVKSAKGGTVNNTDTFLGTPKFVEEGQMYNDIQTILTDMANPTLGKMIKLLEEEGKVKPHLNRVVDGLKQKIINKQEEQVFDEKLRTSFFNVFANASVSYLTLVTEEAEEGRKYRISTSDPSSKTEMLKEEWFQNFKMINGNDVGSKTFYQESDKGGRLTTILKRYAELKEEVKKLKTKEKKPGKRNAVSENDVKVLKSKVIEFFNKVIGIELTSPGLNNFLRKEYGNATTAMSVHAMLTSREMQGVFNDIAAKKEEIVLYGDTIIEQGKGNNVIEDNQIITTLAIRQGEVMFNFGDATTLGPEGNQYSLYSDPSLISQLVNELNTDFEKASGEIRSAVWSSISRTLNWMEEDPSRKIRTFVFNNFKSLDKGDQGIKVSKLSEIEAIIADVNIHLMDNKTAVYTGIAEADKQEQVAMKGGKFEKAGLTFNEQGKITVSNDNAVNILMEYFKAELTRMRLIYENMYGENKIDKSEYIEYLHTDRNLLQSYLFPEFSKTNEEGETLLEELGLVETINGKKVAKKVTEETGNNKELRLRIRRAFVNAVQSDLQVLEEVDVISITQQGEKVVAVNKAIDTTVAARYDDIREAAADYTLNSIIGSIEMTMLFHGDPAGFKPKTNKETGEPLDLFSDFKKRASFVNAGGTMSRIYGDVKPTYTTSVTDEVIAPSDYFFPRKTKQTAPAFEDQVSQEMFGENDVMVFGANSAGGHGQGVAALAYANTTENYRSWNPNLVNDIQSKKVGDFAIAGEVGLTEGNKGTGYGLVTKNASVQNGRLKIGTPKNEAEMLTEIEKLYEVARDNPDKNFIIPYNSDVNLNKKSLKELADMFGKFPIPSNVVFGDKMLAELSKRNLNTALIDRMTKAFNMGKEKDEQLTAAEITEWVKGYKNINIADAQAWITLDLYRQRMLSWSKWSDEHEEAYNRLKNGELLFQDTKLFMQPIKTVHVEPVLKHGHRTTHYHKQSEAVIVPGMFAALDALQEANPETDHFVTIDGKKVGASGVTKINDGDQLVAAEMPFVQLKTKYVYLQQDLKAKGMDDTLVGSQLVKNLLSQILKNGFYEVNFGGITQQMTGEMLVAEYHRVISELSKIGKDKLEQTFGFHLNGTINKEKFNDFLSKALTDELTNSEKALLDTGVSIDAMPAVRKKLENKIAAEVLKASVKLKQTGGAFIQMSNFGTLQDTISLDKETKDGIIWFKDPREGLSPMKLEEKEGVFYTKKAQVLIAHSALLNLIGPKYKSMTPQEIKDAIDPSALEGISYRIPNQATSSNDSFEIVGILPSHMGDTIIAYNEITAKTGSDFDIDKAFVVMPNIEYRDGKITRPRYQHEMTVEEAYEEKTKKDWLKSVRARELFTELESPEKSKKIKIQNALKFVAKKARIKAALGKIANEEEFTALYSTELLEYADQIQKSVDYVISEGIDLGDEFTLDDAKTIKNSIVSIKKELQELNDAHKKAVIAKLQEEKVMPTYEEFKNYPAIKRHTNGALENYRLDLMQALLTDVKTYPSAMASLDSPVLEDAAKGLYDQSTEFGNNLHFFKGTTQRKIKVLFDQSKGLVGVVANHLSHHNSTQMDNLLHSEYLGVGKIVDGKSPVSSISDTEGNVVSNWLSLYMNAIVDAAKDPYIAKANINNYTAPVAFMLLRAGVPIKWVNAFIGQPVLRRLVTKKNKDESKVAKKSYDKKGRRLLGEDQLILEINEDLEQSGIDTFKNGFNEIKKTALKNIGKLSLEDLEKMVENPFAASPRREALILAAFLDYKEKAKDLNEVIRAAKSDVSIGKNLTEAYIRELNLAKVIADNKIENVQKAFGVVEINGQITGPGGYLNIDDSRMVGSYHKNAIQQINKMFSNMSLMSSNAVRSTLFNILFAVNPDKIHDSKAIDDISNEIYSYIASTELAGITDGNFKSLFFGRESTARKMERFKRSNPTFVENNLLLSDMTIIFKDESIGIGLDYIKFRNKNQDRELYQQAWEELYEVNEELADELVKYAFHATGFNRNLFSFYQYIPTNTYIKSGFVSFMNDLNTAAGYPGLLGEKAEETIIKHLSENSRILKTVPNTDKTPLGKGISTNKLFALSNSTDFSIGKNDIGEVEYARYVRDSKSNLFKLVGYTKSNTAVYRQIPKLGFNSAGKAIKEYGVQTILSNDNVSIFDSSGTIFEENKIDPLNKEAAAAISSFRLVGSKEIASTLREGISRNLSDSYEKARRNAEFEEILKRCDI